MVYRFEWDWRKATANSRKHGVRFEQAAKVFQDPRAVTIFDEEHSDNEERWVTMGLVDDCLVCAVHHTYREERGGGAVIRIFSARKATRNETARYWEV